MVFFGRTTAKARDFNWHNVIGVWSAIPLFIVVLSAFPISFPWANALVYQMVGEEPPRSAVAKAVALAAKWRRREPRRWTSGACERR